MERRQKGSFSSCQYSCQKKLVEIFALKMIWRKSLSDLKSANIYKENMEIWINCDTGSRRDNIHFRIGNLNKSGESWSWILKWHGSI